MSDTTKPTGMPLPDALAGNFQDAIRWFNQLWSGAAEPSAAARAGGAAGLPSMMMPTLDVKELEKRIADLRSVEHWLNLNLSLLRTTIQGLEMQRTTLAAWQALGTPSAAPASAAGAAAKGESTSAPEVAPTFQPALWWAALQQQFAQIAANAAAQAGAATAPKDEAASAASSAEVPGTGSKSSVKTKTPGTARPG
ncbi:MAG TPA: PhaM family polyhydroxyalkanoate granule multifunctional regulatory protein [Burkholderiaceae bacterium]|nr:PhaM family polyhydroxyalkanoate granule multifunctional regulatory protein [Burkholderiaceae bacterium]